ncbi:MAG: phage head-tail connector protein [Caulobacterales bacterium]|nr:phage head-tail connector protein [Caulobacterales bacterium]
MIETLVAPIETAINLEQARKYLRIAQDGDDVSLNLLIKAAIERIEARHFKALVSRKVRQSFSTIEIIRAIDFAKLNNSRAYLRPLLNPISSVVSVKELQNQGQFIESSNLIILSNGMFELKNSALAIEIEYWAGFTNIEEIPNSLKLLVLEELARIIETRDNEAIKTDFMNFGGARI